MISSLKIYFKITTNSLEIGEKKGTLNLLTQLHKLIFVQTGTKPRAMKKCKKTDYDRSRHM